jgi:hypothetical protein
VKLPHESLYFIQGPRVYFQNDYAMDLSRYLDGIGNMVAFEGNVLRGWGRVTLEEEAAALLQRALRCSGEVLHAEFGIGPNCRRGKWAPLRSP